MDGMLYSVKFAGGFRDGNVYPRFIKPGEVVEVDEVTYNKMKQSDPDVILLGKKVPKASGPTSEKGKK